MVVNMKPSAHTLPSPLVTSDRDWLGGEPCFTGRRVPVKALFDFVKAGHSLAEFLDAYPSVSREHALAVLDLATKAVTRTADAIA